MKPLSQTRQAIIEQLLQLKPISPHKQYEVILNAAFYDYTEEMLRMVEGKRRTSKEEIANDDWAQNYNEALNDIKEELQG